MSKRKKRQESEHADEVTVGGKRFRGAGAPTKTLKKSKRPDGYSVPAEVIVPRPLALRPMPPCEYGDDKPLTEAEQAVLARRSEPQAM